ncbi:hypothetical protein K438DRAFT_2124413 [Mycena galopus ATCC 62051]|nr:hypothetical protein K438DRAFT_2124413 [Mycena galopus ATCC 62051]
MLKFGGACCQSQEYAVWFHQGSRVDVSGTISSQCPLGITTIQKKISRLWSFEPEPTPATCWNLVELQRTPNHQCATHGHRGFGSGGQFEQPENKTHTGIITCAANPREYRLISCKASKKKCGLFIFKGLGRISPRQSRGQMSCGFGRISPRQSRGKMTQGARVDFTAAELGQMSYGFERISPRQSRGKMIQGARVDFTAAELGQIGTLTQRFMVSGQSFGGICPDFRVFPPLSANFPRQYNMQGVWSSSSKMTLKKSCAASDGLELSSEIFQICYSVAPARLRIGTSFIFGAYLTSLDRVFAVANQIITHHGAVADEVHRIAAVRAEESVGRRCVRRAGKRVKRDALRVLEVRP